MTYVYIGGYTDPDRGGRGEGITVYRMEDSTGVLTHLQTLSGIQNPHFLVLHPNRRFAYSTNGGDASGVSAFAVDGATGRIELLNRQPSPGPGPTHLGVDPTGRLCVVANYAGGSVAAYPIEPTGHLAPHSDFILHKGKTGPNPKRQDKPHAHMAGFDPTGQWVLVCDLGLDRTFVYAVDAGAGRLTPVGSAPATNPGAGPRHLTFHPNGRTVYVINELEGSLDVFDFAAGALTHRQHVTTLPADFSGENISAEVVVHPSGRFVYGSNRGHNSLAIFAADAGTGLLEARGQVSCGGQHPRHFEIDPSGRFLYCANQDTDNVVQFAIDQATGALTPAGRETRVGTPSCAMFLA